MSNASPNILITRNHLDGVSDTFLIGTQSTVYAMGLQPGDVVEFFVCLVSDLVRSACVCPPGNVVLPSVVDEVPLTCCGVPITLDRDKPFVVLDAPQGIRLRAKLTQLDPNEPLSTQIVWFNNTHTANVNDRLRGCPCQETP